MSKAVVTFLADAEHSAPGDGFAEALTGVSAKLVHDARKQVCPHSCCCPLICHVTRHITPRHTPLVPPTFSPLQLLEDVQETFMEALRPAFRRNVTPLIKSVLAPVENLIPDALKSFLDIDKVATASTCVCVWALTPALPLSSSLSVWWSTRPTDWWCLCVCGLTVSDGQ